MSHPNFVCFTEDEKGWLKERTRVVTGSWIAALMGMNPWKSRQDAIDHIRGNGKPFVPSRHSWWGSQMEVANMRCWSLMTGLEASPVNAFFAAGPVGSTIDGVILEPHSGLEGVPLGTSAKTYWTKTMEALREACEGNEEPFLIEMKQTSEKYLKDWGKQPPDSYWAQLQLQLHLTGLRYGFLVARVGASDMRHHLVKRDDLWVEEAVEAAQEILNESA